MRETSGRYIQRTLLDTGNATSSPGLGCGVTPLGSLGGGMTGPCGPDHVLANLSARQAEERGLLTSGTSGRLGSISSQSVGLQLSLASRLRRRMVLDGSTLFRLTWKVRVTPSGWQICALRGSGRRTSGNDCGSWPTPDMHSGSGGRTSSDPLARTRPSGTKKQFTINEAAQLASWATPVARDFRFASLKPWAERGGGKKGEQLNNQVVHLADQAVLSGPPPNGSGVKTASIGQLNPAHPRWLMGLPPEWDVYAPTVTVSRRKSPPSL